MKTRLLLFGALLALVNSVAARAGAGGFVVVLNRDNAQSSLTRSQLKRAVTGGLKQWPNGAVVQLGIIPGDAPDTQYLASLLDLSARELLSRIQEAVFKGELRRPAVLRSSAECVAFARGNAGAICVTSDGEPLPPEVHAVAIQ
ncbi:MAG: hypothetical protein WBY94_09795 [Polyangiaceae bacterium]